MPALGRRGGPELAHPNWEAAPVEPLAESVALDLGEPRSSFLAYLQSYQNKRDICSLGLGWE